MARIVDRLLVRKLMNQKIIVYLFAPASIVGEGLLQILQTQTRDGMMSFVSWLLTFIISDGNKDHNVAISSC